jgi:hypothetical protein
MIGVEPTLSMVEKTGVGVEVGVAVATGVNVGVAVIVANGVDVAVTLTVAVAVTVVLLTDTPMLAVPTVDSLLLYPRQTSMWLPVAIVLVFQALEKVKPVEFE